MAVFAPDGALLVSRPGAGEVVRLVPGPDGPTSTTLVVRADPAPRDDVRRQHPLRRREQRRALLPLRGPGPRHADDRRRRPARRTQPGAGRRLRARAQERRRRAGRRRSTSRWARRATSRPEDREADPQRAAILRVPPGGGAPEPFARGVRNGTGLAVAPDGAVWTAVNNRDNIPFPYDRPYGEDDGSARGRVIPDYVDDHPPEELARLTPGRDLGWPYCNPDPDVAPGVAGQRRRPVRPAVRGRRRDQPRRPHARLRDAPADRADDGRALGAARPGLRRDAARALRAGRAGRRARLVEPAVAPRARGVVLPVARTATSAASAPSSAASRRPTGRGGDARSRRCPAPTAPCTSPTTRRARSTAWHPPVADFGRAQPFARAAVWGRTLP